MPHFFFDAHDGTSYGRDEDGHIVASLETAQDLALQCLPFMARDQFHEHGKQQDFEVVVRNEAGQVVYKASLSLLVQGGE